MHFRLLFSNADAPDTESDGSLWLVLAVPEGPSLVAVTTGAPSLEPLEPARFRRGTCALEPIEIAGQHRLLLLSPPGSQTRVNGMPVPGIALLGLKDEALVGGGPGFHVTARSTPFFGAPPATHVGRPCPVCSVPFAEGTTILVCGACGIAVHAEGDEHPAAGDRADEDRLECDRLVRVCPGCRATLSRDARPTLLYEPDA